MSSTAEDARYAHRITLRGCMFTALWLQIVDMTGQAGVRELSAGEHAETLALLGLVAFSWTVDAWRGGEVFLVSLSTHGLSQGGSVLTRLICDRMSCGAHRHRRHHRRPGGTASLGSK
jgi:hypothetical protein